jgi:hypothetical protein
LLEGGGVKTGAVVEEGDVIVSVGAGEGALFVVGVERDAEVVGGVGEEDEEFALLD